MNDWKKERYKRMILQNLTVTNGFLTSNYFISINVSMWRLNQSIRISLLWCKI